MGSKNRCVVIQPVLAAGHGSVRLDQYNCGTANTGNWRTFEHLRIKGFLIVGRKSVFFCEQIKLTTIISVRYACPDRSENVRPNQSRIKICTSILVEMPWRYWILYRSENRIEGPLSRIISCKVICVNIAFMYTCIMYRAHVYGLSGFTAT